MTAAATISCPACKKKFKGKLELDNQKIRCPNCDEPFLVRLGETLKVDRGGAALEPAAAPAASPHHHHHEDEDDEDNPNPYGVTTVDLAARCPNCANPMASEDAVVCLICGYNTETRAWGRTERTIGTTGGQRVWWLVPGIVCALTAVVLAAGSVYYCLELPYVVADSWMRFMDSESTRMWVVIGTLFLIWGCGYFAYHRLILNPMPPEEEKE